MNLFGSPSVLAPQPAGQYDGLLDIDRTSHSEFRVAALASENGTFSTSPHQFSDSRSGGQDPRGKRAKPANDQPSVAPPSILQMKIDAMLREQAEAIARNMPDDPSQSSVSKETPPSADKAQGDWPETPLDALAPDPDKVEEAAMDLPPTGGLALLPAPDHSPETEAEATVNEAIEQVFETAAPDLEPEFPAAWQNPPTDSQVA